VSREALGAGDGDGGLPVFFHSMKGRAVAGVLVWAVLAGRASAMTPMVGLTQEDPAGTFAVHDQVSGSPFPVQVAARGYMLGITMALLGNFSGGLLYQDTVAIVGGGRFTMRLNAFTMTQSFQDQLFCLGVLAGLAQAYGAGMAPLGSVWVFEPQLSTFVLADGKLGIVLSRRLIVAHGGYAWSTRIGLTMRGPELLKAAPKAKESGVKG